MSPSSLQVVLQGCQRALLGMWLPQGFTTSVIFTFTHYLVSMSYCQKFRLFVIYMSKLVSPRSGQKVCTIQDWKIHPRITFTIATNQFHLPKNNDEDLNPVSKMAFNKWNMDFCWEYTVRKKGLPFQMFHCSQKFPGGMIQKVVFHLLFNWILKKILVNGKQPYFQHYILLVEAIYI